MGNGRTGLRILANRLFVRYPALGYWGYALLRDSGLSRSAVSARRLFRHLRQVSFQPSVILDIGANTGEWSWIGRRAYPEAIFRLIEPQTEMAPFLARFCRGSPDARWLLAGAGAEVGERMLTLWEDFQGSSFLPEPETDRNATNRQRLLPLVTIDSLIAERWTPVPDLVKLDIQGLELEALRGCERCFGITEAFVVEVSFFETYGYPPFEDIVSFLAAREYVLFDIVDLKRQTGGALVQADACFVRRGGSIRRGLGWD